jgi:O-antigen/teichoic acid export membrane protein
MSSETGRTIAKNATVLMLSQGLTWALTLLLTIFLPRYLGVTAIGKWHLANSLWMIVNVVIAFGMGTLITKEVARSPEKLTSLFNTSLWIRTFLYVFGFVALVIYAYAVNYPEETIIIIFIVGISSLFGQYAGVSRAALEGLERMEYIAIAEILSKLVYTVVAIILLLLGYGLVAIASVAILSALANLFIITYFLNRLSRLRFSFSRKQIAWMLKASVPYFMSGIFWVIYAQIDVVFISLLVSEDGVGWYSAADRLFGTFLFIPTIFLTAVFPAMSRTYLQGVNSMSALMGKSFDLLLIISMPMGLGLLAVANSLVVLLFGAEFANSGPILAIFGIVLIFTYQNMLLGQFLISSDRQNKVAVIMAVATFATIPLDLLFIPLSQSLFNNGAIGGAMAFVVTEVGMMIAMIRYLPAGALTKRNVKLAAKVILAGFVMLGVVWWLRDFFVALPIIIGMALYLALIAGLRVITPEDWAILKDVAQAMFARLRRRQPEPVP